MKIACSLHLEVQHSNQQEQEKMDVSCFREQEKRSNLKDQ